MLSNRPLLSGEARAARALEGDRQVEGGIISNTKVQGYPLTKVTLGGHV